MKPIEVKNKKFGRLTVIEELPKKNNKRFVKCMCDCGNEKQAFLDNVASGKTNSCGCIHRERVSQKNSSHGLSKTREFTIWMNMKARCTNSKNNSFHRYGGRGIKICDRWMLFENFISDMGLSNGLTLDRIDVDKDYSPENCRWATIKEQANNTRKNVYVNINGKRETLKQACERLNLNYKTVHMRISRGQTPELAIKFYLEKKGIN